MQLVQLSGQDLRRYGREELGTLEVDDGVLIDKMNNEHVLECERGILFANYSPGATA